MTHGGQMPGKPRSEGIEAGDFAPLARERLCDMAGPGEVVF